MSEQSESSEKYKLEKERLEIERLKLEDSRRFSSKYFGIIVTAAVTLVVAMISGSQVLISEINKKKEIERQTLVNEAQFNQTKLEQDRRFKLDIGRFVIDRQKIIFAEGNKEEKVQIREVLLLIFPPEITARLFSRLERSTKFEYGEDSESALLWGEGQAKAKAQITDNIRGILATKANQDISEVQPDSELGDDILPNNTDREQFYQSVEQNYNINLSDKEIKELNTPNKISDYITNK